MERFSNWLSEKMYLGAQIKAEERDDVCFALEVILSHLLTFGTILLIGLTYEKGFETLIFVFLFALFRTLDDSYHAKTFFRCFVLTVGSFLISFLISEIIIFEFQNKFIILMSILNIILVVSSNHFYKHHMAIKYRFLMILLNVAIVACLPIVNKALLIYIELVALMLIISTLFYKKYE